MAEKAKTVAETNEAAAETFEKEMIVRSKRYAKHRDLLAVSLSGKKRYTLDEVDAVIEKGGAN